MILYQDCSRHLDSSKNMAAKGRGLFSLYIYIENFKKSSCQKPLDRFQYNFAEMFLWFPLPRLFKPFGFVKKHGRQGTGLIFPIYLYRKFKNLLVRNHWTDFNIILQKCSFSDPQGRLFKPFGFVKKHGRQGGAAYFPYISI